MALNPLFLISANPLLAAPLIALLLAFAHIDLPLRLVSCEDATRFLTWNVAYTNMSILGNKPKQVITINGMFPGPEIDAVTNDNLAINVINNLDEPLLITWNGIWQRRTSWQDGVTGTNCPIPAGGRNFTYNFQVKDQIGSYSYFPSTSFHKSAGGYGGFKISNRVVIPVPYPAPDGDAFVLIGDWYNADHKRLRVRLNSGRRPLGPPDGVVINGRGPMGTTLTFEAGKTYLLRVANVGTSASLNFRIEGHKMKLVEAEGSHTSQITYDDLDVHVGQSYSVLVTMDQAPGDYYIVASTRFAKPALSGVAVLHYASSPHSSKGWSMPRLPRPLPAGPAAEIGRSLAQARSIRWNLTANAARPNPQGSFHYGAIGVSRTVVLSSSGAAIGGKLRYSVNGLSYVPPAGNTPLKLADYFNLSGAAAFSMPDAPPPPASTVPLPRLATPVLSAAHRSFVEIVFQNSDDAVDSWHVDGYSFFVVGMDAGAWTPGSRREYNLVDAIYRSTVQVYPNSWTAVLMELDNVGMWNVRSQLWERQFLGQQFYMRVVTPEASFRNEAPIPSNVLLCGLAKKLRPGHIAAG